jgi:hypothetical protein
MTFIKGSDQVGSFFASVLGDPLFKPRHVARLHLLSFVIFLSLPMKIP